MDPFGTARSTMAPLDSFWTARPKYMYIHLIRLGRYTARLRRQCLPPVVDPLGGEGAGGGHPPPQGTPLGISLGPP